MPYYRLADGNAVGPLRPDQIGRLVARKELKPGDQIRGPDGRWRPLREYPDLVAAVTSMVVGDARQPPKAEQSQSAATTADPPASHPPSTDSVGDFRREPFPWLRLAAAATPWCVSLAAILGIVLTVTAMTSESAITWVHAAAVFALALTAGLAGDTAAWMVAVAQSLRQQQQQQRE